ncbi:MAG TPA: hypothetical protein VFL86_14870 [Burkholderiaceae bacterium]|nr:hypothetical protein [Burkholderiaceae bacterium]
MGSPVIARLFALVLALVLAWSGLAAPQPAHAAAEQVPAALQAEGPQHPGQGLVGEPAGDDPSDTQSDAQSHAETLSDLPALAPERHAAQVPALTMARPGPYTLAALHPPYLDGLRRPPRA